MSLEFEELTIPDYERVVKVENRDTGLLAIIAIHDTTLGPALGGTRILPYVSLEEALTDVLRLSKGMTYKSALAQTGLGGGKSVIIAHPEQKTPEFLASFGEAIDQLKGQYICAEDVGCTPKDLQFIRRETRYITGLECVGSSGNPSPFTAWGTFRAIQSVIHQLDNIESVEGKIIAIQGLGNVGAQLAHFLFWAGARLIVQDIDQEKEQYIEKKCSAEVVSSEEIFQVECDVFAPCALGGIINENSIPKLRCRAIAGAANNQLLEEQKDGIRLKEKDILYAPDFVGNAGGLINVAREIDPGGYDAASVRKKIDAIYERLLTIYDVANKNRSSIIEAAIALADYRLQYGIGKREKEVCFHHSAD